MVFQAHAVSQALGVDIVDRASLRYLASQPPVIITSAGNPASNISPETVLSDARRIFGRDDVRLVAIDDFGSLASETSQSPASRDIWLQVHRPNYPSDGTLHNLSVNIDGEWVPTERLIRELELKTFKSLNEATNGGVMNAYEDVLRAIAGYGPVDRPVATPTGPAAGGWGGRLRASFNVLKEYGPLAGASVLTGLLVRPEHLAVVNGASWIVRGAANVPILVAPGKFGPNTLPGRIARGVITVTFLGNAAYHDLSFKTGAGTPFNQFYAVSDHGFMAQNLRDVREGRAAGPPNWAKYTTLASANVANTALLMLSSIPAGPAAWIPNLLFGGATAYSTYRAVRTDLAAREGTTLPPAKIGTKIAGAASIVGLVAFGTNYLITVAFPNLRKSDDKKRDDQNGVPGPLPTVTPPPTPSYNLTPTASPSPTS